MPKKLVFLLPEECRFSGSGAQDQPSSNSGLIAVPLPKPKDKTRACFMFSADKTKLYEINKFSEPHQAWLLRDQIIPGGDLYIVTPTDPLFMILSYVAKNAKFFAPLDHTVKDHECHGVSWLVKCVKPSDMEKICERKVAGSQEVYRYDENKTMDWLEAKVKRLSSGLREKGMLGGRSANFVVAKKKSDDDEAMYIAESFGIISDYLEPEMASSLRERLAIPLDSVANSSSPPAADEGDENLEPAAKKAKIGEPDEDYSKGFQRPDAKGDKDAKKSVAQKKLADAAKGTKSIMSFFGKPKAK